MCVCVCVCVYCYLQTDCFVESKFFSMARHVERLKSGSKPDQLYVRLNIRPLGSSQRPKTVSVIILLQNIWGISYMWVLDVWRLLHLFFLRRDITKFTHTHTHTHAHTHTHIYIYIYICVCVCVCARAYKKDLTVKNLQSLIDHNKKHLPSCVFCCSSEWKWRKVKGWKITWTFSETWKGWGIWNW